VKGSLYSYHSKIFCIFVNTLKTFVGMLLTLEIDEHEADNFLQAVRLLKGFRQVKEPQNVVALPTQTTTDIRTLCLETPFLTSEQIDQDLNELKNEWESDI
jgi:hypothetical protein